MYTLSVDLYALLPFSNRLGVQIFIIGTDASIIRQNCWDTVDYISGSFSHVDFLMLVEACRYTIKRLVRGGDGPTHAIPKVPLPVGVWTDVWLVQKWLHQSRCSWLTHAGSRNNVLVGWAIGATWWIRLNLPLYQLKGNSTSRFDSAYICNLFLYPLLTFWNVTLNFLLLKYPPLQQGLSSKFLDHYLTVTNTVLCGLTVSRLWLQGHALFASDTSKLQKHSITIYLVNARHVVFIRVIMAALWNRAGHYIFILQFLLLSIFLFLLAKSQPSQTGCLP